MKKWNLVFSLALSLSLFAACGSAPTTETSTNMGAPAAAVSDAAQFAKHPLPKDPIYFDKSIYEVIKKRFPAPPISGSRAQALDEEELRKLQKIRTAVECEKARTEVQITLKSGFGAPEGTLTNFQIEIVEPFLGKINNDASYIIYRLKDDFPRQRPYDYIAGLEPCVLRERSPAYPSGHTALSRLTALVLGDLIPADRDKFIARAQEIANNRILSGVHHPSDVASGKRAADRIYKELKKSSKFKMEFDEVKAKLK